MATTSLGRLTLDLAVRLSDFTDGLTAAERATEERTRNMGRSVSKFKDQMIDDLSGTPIGSAIDSLTDRLGTITEAFGDNGIAGAAKIGAASIIASTVGIGVALTGMAIQVAETDQQLEMLAKRANVTTTQFQVLTAATEKYGIDNEGLSDILADVQEKLGEFAASGAGGLVDTLELLQNNTKMTAEEVEAFGVSLSNVDGATAIQMVKDKLEEANSTAQTTRFTMESLASGLGDISEVWQDNGDTIAEYEKALYSAGVIRTEEAIEQSRLLKLQVEDTQRKFQGMSNQLVTHTTPALNSVVGYFAEGTKQGDGFASSVSGIGVVISGVAKTIIGFSSVVNLAVIGFQGLMDQFFVLGQTGTAFLNADGLFAKVRALQEGSRAFAASGESTNQRFHDEAMRAAEAIRNTGAASIPTSANYGATSELERLRREQELLKESNIISTKTADENAKAIEAQAKAADKLTKAQARLVGIAGNSGIGTGSHIDIRYASGDARRGSKPSQDHINRFEVNGKALGSLVKTSDFNLKRKHPVTGKTQPHYGVDYDSEIGDSITTKVPVKDVKPWYDSKGGGYVTTVTFADGVKMNLLHQSSASKGIKGGASGGSTNAYSTANSQSQQLILKDKEDYAREQERLAAEAVRRQEAIGRAQLSIANQYASDKEKIELDHIARVESIEEAYAEGSADRAKYLAREEERYAKEKNATALSIMERYQSEEERIHAKHQKALKEIEAANIRDDSVRQMYVDMQNAAYQEDLDNFKFASQAKAREQDKFYQSIANSARANGINSIGTGLDAMAQRTMSDNDYQGWRLGQDRDQAFNSVNDQYANRQAEINAVDERGDYALPELERFELLEIAKQEHLEAMWSMEQEFALRTQTLEEQQAAQRVAIQESAFGSMTSAAAMFFGENSKMHRVAFAMEKAYAVQKALMNVEETYSNTYNAISAIPLVGPYIAAPMAAAASAMQVARAAGIGGMSAPSVAGIAHGGLDYVPKESTYLLDKGERVLSPNQNSDLTKFMKGGDKSGLTINNYSSAKVTASDDGKTITITDVRNEVKRGFTELQNPNSHNAKMVKSSFNTTTRR